MQKRIFPAVPGGDIEAADIQTPGPFALQAFFYRRRTKHQTDPAAIQAAENEGMPVMDERKSFT
ncbi:hypothetical protein [Roseibium suaedae]|uniref:Uncharacterized protein n=1 Tax=Roseibium suaedae TaxID=735517 RepID=A0A1M7PIH3_9HYPH|nr:hypothetical protein [Roseibium suaedae]SHN16909.1 hypothetical protein SAMN05444272_4438 [Roseibium suaedae]